MTPRKSFFSQQSLTRESLICYEYEAYFNDFNEDTNDHNGFEFSEVWVKMDTKGTFNCL